MDGANLVVHIYQLDIIPRSTDSFKDMLSSYNLTKACCCQQKEITQALILLMRTQYVGKLKKKRLKRN